MNSKSLNNIILTNIARLIYSRTGINFEDEKIEILENKLISFCQKNNIKNLRELYHHIKKDNELFLKLLNRILVNVTEFFRHREQFEFLENEFFKEYVKPLQLKNIMIWSAGCATGEEPYSIAISMEEGKLINNVPELEYRIVASDFSTKAISYAKTGIYPVEKVKNIKYEILKKYFLRGTGKKEGYVKVKRFIRLKVEFKYENLMEVSYINQFDSIFFRNVMIYFDTKIKNLMLEKMYNALKRNGFLFTGASENIILQGEHRFKLIRNSIYKRL